MNPSSRAQVPEVLKRQKCFIHIDLEQMRLGLSSDVPLVSQQWNAIIAVNYAARKFGITRLHHSVFDAKQLCPGGVNLSFSRSDRIATRNTLIKFLPPNIPSIDLVCAHVATLGPGDSEPDYYPSPSRYTHKVSLDPYRKASAKIYSVFRKHCTTFQKGGLDEVFMDVTDIVNKRLMDEYGTDLSKRNLNTAQMIDWAKDHPEAGVVFGMPKDGSDVSAATTVELDEEDENDLILNGEGGIDQDEPADDDDDIDEAVGVDAVDDLDKFLSAHPDINLDDDFDDDPGSAPHVVSFNTTLSTSTTEVSANNTTHGTAEKSAEELKQEEEAEKERLRIEKEHLLPYYGVAEGTFEEQFWAEMQLLKAAEFCNEIRQSVKDELNYTCSAGISSNKLLAKLGSGMNKPFQQTIILPKYVPDLLHGLKLGKIRNLGGKFGKQVKTDYNIERASQLWIVPLRELQHRYGEQAGLELWQWCRGIDHVGIRKIKSKSMCSHKSFIPALSDMEEIQFWITSICLELVSRINAEYEETERWPRTISLGFFGGIRARRDQETQEKKSTWRPPHKGSRSMPFGSRFEYGGVEVSNFAGGHGSNLGDITKFFSKAPVATPTSKLDAKSTGSDNTSRALLDTSMESRAEWDLGQTRHSSSSSSSSSLSNKAKTTTAPSATHIRKRFFKPRSQPSPLSSPIKSLQHLQVSSGPDCGLQSGLTTEAGSPSSNRVIDSAPAQPTTLLCEKCPAPGQHILVGHWDEHVDYHFAMSLLQDDRKQHQIDRQNQIGGALNSNVSNSVAKRTAPSGSGQGSSQRGKRKKVPPLSLSTTPSTSEAGATSLAKFFKPM
ncbi:DNA-directed DNA polymerase eta rad30 [Podila humilis]|nr:DNA-directed DNA polymerase eta rad30 [Podila humilis]